MERILAVFAHPDDEAFCVGTLANHSDTGDAVQLLWLSRGENTTVLRMDREAKIRERGRQEERLRAFFAIDKGMYGAWPVEELVFARLTSHGRTAACRLAEAFESVQLGKADRLLV